MNPNENSPEIRMDSANLYREETFTDNAVGTLRPRWRYQPAFRPHPPGFEPGADLPGSEPMACPVRGDPCADTLWRASDPVIRASSPNGGLGTLAHRVKGLEVGDLITVLLFCVGQAV